MHNVHYKNCHVAKAATPRSQVSKRLVTRCVNNKEPWNLQINLLTMLQPGEVLDEIFLGKVGSANLLRNSASFAHLHVGFAEFV